MRLWDTPSWGVACPMMIQKTDTFPSCGSPCSGPPPLAVRWSQRVGHYLWTTIMSLTWKHMPFLLTSPWLELGHLATQGRLGTTVTSTPKEEEISVTVRGPCQASNVFRHLSSCLSPAGHTVDSFDTRHWSWVCSSLYSGTHRQLDYWLLGFCYTKNRHFKRLCQLLFCSVLTPVFFPSANCIFHLVT